MLGGLVEACNQDEVVVVARSGRVFSARSTSGPIDAGEPFVSPPGAGTRNLAENANQLHVVVGA